MKRTFLLASLISTLLIGTPAGAAPVYKWIDKSGHTHYSNYKPPLGETRSPVGDDRVSVVTPRWSKAMKTRAREFMNRARVRRIWVDQNGRRVKGWY